MKIDKDKLDALVAMSDGELWGEIRKIASAHGFTLPDRTPEHSEMEKIRGAVSGGARINLGEAVRILNDYKRRCGK
ncbi:MAG: hypothetical protein IJW48_03355 [Clostridia bacterium]|nr:hypothetical protein [Clostridia bacterium]